MNTSSIEKCLKNLLCGRDVPIYVIATDETDVISYDKFPIIVVQNTREDTHTGQHWTAWIVWSKESADFFDSYGQGPEKYPLMKWPAASVSQRNYNVVQGSTTYVCGEHCVYWSYNRIRGVSYKAIMRSYLKWTWYNDKMVTNFVNRIPNCHRHSLYYTCRRAQSCVCRLEMLLQP